MEITPIEIHQQHFKNRLFGYDKAGVDRFLEAVAEELEKLHRENHELRENLARTRSAMEEMRERETILQETLITTQKITEDLKQSAHREANLIIKEGQLKADRIIRGAEEKRFLILDEINELHRQKIVFQTALSSLLESHRKMLEMNFDGSDEAFFERRGDEIVLINEEDKIAETELKPGIRIAEVK